MTDVFLIIACVTYLVSAGYIAKHFFSGKALANLPKIILVSLTIIAIVTQGYSLFIEFSAANANFTMVNIIAALSWSMVLVLVLSTFFIKQWSLLPVTYSFAGFCTLLMLISPSSYAVQVYEQVPMFLHITLSLSGYGCVVIALLYALQMRYIHLQLKEKNLALTKLDLPPLLQVEHWVLRLIYIGSIFLLFALVSGFATLDSMLGKEYIHKTVLSALALLIFICMLFWQRYKGLRPNTILVTTALGVFILTLGYFGSRLVQDVLLS